MVTEVIKLRKLTLLLLLSLLLPIGYLISLQLSSDLVAFPGLLRLLSGGVGDLGRGIGFGIAFLDLGFLPRTLLVN